jgi:hypothetical protein
MKAAAKSVRPVAGVNVANTPDQELTRLRLLCAAWATVIESMPNLRSLWFQMMLEASRVKHEEGMPK